MIVEHIRKRRIDPGLLQIEVAKIIEFLGYVPFECPDDPVGTLRHFKLFNGSPYELLGAVMDRDPEQLTDWLRGRLSRVREIFKVSTTF